MKKNVIWQTVVVLDLASMLMAFIPAAPAEKADFVFGILMVGPYNDRGWSQAHYDAGLYVEKKVPGTKMIYVDKVNPADRPGTTGDQLAEDLVHKVPN